MDVGTDDLDRLACRHEHQRAGNEIFLGRWRRAGRQLTQDFLGIGRLLGRGDVARRFHKRSELSVGDIGLVHPETINANVVCRLLIGPADVGIRAHGEFAARNPDHPGRRLVSPSHHGIGGRERTKCEQQEQKGAGYGPGRLRWLPFLRGKTS
jgi:hypothetical protein